ncbi:ABC transporter substrate-binding protein [Chloroflexota bacterium]
MSNLKLSLGHSTSDRSQALEDGRVIPEGIELTVSTSAAGDIFQRMRQTGEFDISEMSISHYLIDRCLENPKYIAIPVFTKMFRNAYVYLNRHSGIKAPGDLKQKKVGIPRYSTSGTLWIRGILQHEYGVAPSDIRWYMGGKEGPKQQDRKALGAPEDLPLQQVPPSIALSDMLVAGEIDALITPVDPPWEWKNHPNVGRLWPNYREVEMDYYRRTRIFPIMHTVVIKQEIYNANPWVAKSMFHAFCEAKKLCGYISYSSGAANMLPWSIAEYEATAALMGENFYQYGAEANRAALETTIQYSYEQKLSSRKVSFNELFAEETSGLLDS